MCRDGVQQSCHALDIDCCETASVRAVLAIVHRHAHVQGGAFLVGRYDSSSWLQQQGPSTPEQALAETVRLEKASPAGSHASSCESSAGTHLDICEKVSVHGIASQRWHHLVQRCCTSELP